MSEYNGAPNEPVVWRLLEALLVNVLIVVSIVVMLVSMVWDWISGFFQRNR